MKRKSRMAKIRLSIRTYRAALALPFWMRATLLHCPFNAK